MFLELIVALVTLATVIYLVFSSIRKPKNLPPGPRPLPILGNVLELVGWMAKKETQLELTKAAKKYGKIFTLELPGERMVVISSASIAREALQIMKDDFAGRPYQFTIDFLTRGSKDIGAGDFGPTWVLQRKIVHSAMRAYNPFLEAKANKEVEDLYKRLSTHEGKPLDPFQDIILTIMNIICAMVYGERYEIDDPEFQMIVDYNQKMFSVISALSVLNIFPFLIHFPIQDSITIKYVRDTRDRLLDSKYHEHQESYQEGTIRDLTDALIKALDEAKQEDNKVHDIITEDHVVMTMADAFSVGFETVTSTILWFIVYMLNYPDVQAKIQSELDDVIGRDVMPQWEDRNRLPYLEATISETLRVSSVAAVPIPHRAIRDASLVGYNIPKGTTVLFNIWAMHYDEEEWENPQEFNPARFLDADGKFINAAGVRSFLPFGAGRRVCVGEALARQELFIVLSRLLHRLEFENPPDVSPPGMVGEMGLVHTPKPYKVCVKVRRT